VAILFCITAALAIVALLSGDFDDEHAQVLLSTTALSLYGLFAAPSTLLLEEGRDRGLAACSLTLIVAAAALALFLIWGLWDADGDAEAVLKTWAILSELGLATALVAANRPRPSDADQVRALLGVATGTALGAAAMGVVAVLQEVEDGDYYRALGVVAVVHILCVALVPIRRRTAAAAEPMRFAVTTDTGRRIEVDVRRAAGTDGFSAAAQQGARETGGPIRSVERLDP
jgi:hypothetical protein